MDGVDGEPGVGAESEVMREESVSDRVAKLVESCRALQEAASSHSAQRQHEADALSKQAVTHLDTLKKLQGDLYSGCEKGEISHRTAKKVSFLSFIPLNFFTEVFYVTQQIHVCLIGFEFLWIEPSDLCGTLCTSFVTTPIVFIILVLVIKEWIFATIVRFRPPARDHRR